MFNAFARFDDQKAADNASRRILDTTNGITRIGSRKVVPSRRQIPNDHAADAISTTVAHSAAMINPEQSVNSDTISEAAVQEAEYDRRTGIEPPRKPYYILCAQGEKEAVMQAAKLKRDFGGSNVDVRDAKGDFLSGQPGIK